MGTKYYEFTMSEVTYLSERLLDATKKRCTEQKIPFPKRTYGKWGIPTETHPRIEDGSFIKQYHSFNTEHISANHIYKKLSDETSKIKKTVFEDLAKYCGTDKDGLLKEITIKAEGNNITGNSKLNKLIDTSWELYLYNYKIKATQTPEIIRLILKIKKRNINNNLNIDLENLEGENTFTGEIINKEHNNNILFLSLNTDDEEKNLTVILNVSTSLQPINNIFLGQYIDNEAANEIITGTVLLKRIDNQNSSIKPRIYKLGTTDIEEVDETIVEFLKYKILNFTKTPTAKYNLKDLKAWLDNKRKDEFYKNLKSYFDANLGDNKYDAFISAPVTSLDEEKRAKFKDDMKEMLNFLEKNCGLENTYYYPLYKRKSNSKSDLLTHEINKIRKSKIFALIYPEKIASSVLVELGIVLCLNKPVVVFYRNKEDLPTIIRKDLHQKHPLIHWHEYNSLMEIPEILCTYF